MLTIGHLYPKQMNVYGDMGNVTTLKYRLEARGFEVRYEALASLGDIKSVSPDILIGGGGQDSNQEVIQSDVLRYRNDLATRLNDGMTALMVCGMYQLLGNIFVLPNGKQITGAGVIDMETTAGEDRIIGNLVVESAYGTLVGFENHSGRTYLASNVLPLGRVVKGVGNNEAVAEEGVEVNNLFGTYLHGPALVKNPQWADELIIRTLRLKYGITTLLSLDDTLERLAARETIKRPR